MIEYVTSGGREGEHGSTNGVHCPEDKSSPASTRKVIVEIETEIPVGDGYGSDDGIAGALAAVGAQHPDGVVRLIGGRFA